MAILLLTVSTWKHSQRHSSSYRIIRRSGKEFDNNTTTSPLRQKQSQLYPHVRWRGGEQRECMTRFTVFFLGDSNTCNVHKPNYKTFWAFIIYKAFSRLPTHDCTNLRRIAVDRCGRRAEAEQQPTSSSQMISPAGPDAPSSSWGDTEPTGIQTEKTNIQTMSFL